MNKLCCLINPERLCSKCECKLCIECSSAKCNCDDCASVNLCNSCVNEK